MLSFASATASSSVLKVLTPSTGPNTSSFQSEWLGSTSKTVGLTKKPLLPAAAGRVLPPVTSVAPSASADLMKARTFSYLLQHNQLLCEVPIEELLGEIIIHILSPALDGVLTGTG
eukprot:COSAG02_NODE_22_length_53020_cov_16.223125_50_plen_116_part_00